MKYFYKNIELEIPENVYEPREDSLLLAKALEKVRGKKVLEIGCGSGLLSIILAKNGCEVSAADINGEAVETTRKNAKRNNVEIEAFQSDLLEKVKGKFDLIAFNPPYLPDKDKIGGNEAWSNKGAIERFIKQAGKFLNKNGRILIVISSLTGVERIRKLFRKEGFEARIAAEQKIPWEKLVVLECI